MGTVADVRVELRQVGALGGEDGGGALQPIRQHGGRKRRGHGSYLANQAPQRNAGVSTGASQNFVMSPSSFNRVMDAPAISRLVM